MHDEGMGKLGQLDNLIELLIRICQIHLVSGADDGDLEHCVVRTKRKDSTPAATWDNAPQPRKRVWQKGCGEREREREGGRKREVSLPFLVL